MLVFLMQIKAWIELGCRGVGNIKVVIIYVVAFV